jgi:hypothetical protein
MGLRARARATVRWMPSFMDRERAGRCADRFVCLLLGRTACSNAARAATAPRERAARRTNDCDVAGSAGLGDGLHAGASTAHAGVQGGMHIDIGVAVQAPSRAIRPDGILTGSPHSHFGRRSSSTCPPRQQDNRPGPLGSGNKPSGQRRRFSQNSSSASCSARRPDIVVGDQKLTYTSALNRCRWSDGFLLSPPVKNGEWRKTPGSTPPINGPEAERLRLVHPFSTGQILLGDSGDWP